MNIASLIEQIKAKGSYLCVGLDTDAGKLPASIKDKPNAVVEFNKAIIDATKDFCVSYKINTAFYESQGLKGWQAMEETLHYIPNTHFSIADAKRGDIGNTSAQYAKTFFEVLPFDSVTVNPYMGEDSIRPFLEYEDKVTILLGLTSNKGASDFELQPLYTPYHETEIVAEVSQDGFQAYSKKETEIRTLGNESQFSYLYEMVLRKSSEWGNKNNMMYVAGATRPQQLADIRKIIPDHFLLVPGVGAQGGSLEEVSQYGMNADCGLLVNVSRAVIYASLGEDFALKAGEAAREYQQQMKPFTLAL